MTVASFQWGFENILSLFFSPPPETPVSQLFWFSSYYFGFIPIEPFCKSDIMFTERR